MSKRLTINDIAQIAGVAKSTVSRYLNNGKISEEMKEKIKKVIDEYQYEPNAFAQSLKAKKTRFVGIIAPGLDSLVTSKVIMEMDDHLRLNDYNPLIINTSQKKELEIESIENLARLKVDGIILVATELTKAHKEVIKSLPVPIVIVGQMCEEAICIVNNDYQAGFVMGKYIKDAGHHHIVYLGVEESDVAVGINRKQGVIDGLNALNADNNVSIVVSDFTSERAEEVISECLKNDKPSAIICATDRMAIGAKNAIEKHGYKIPDDISVTGFGGYYLSTLVKPNLTTIKFENEKTGSLAATTMIKLIDGQAVEKTQVINFELIKQDSVKKIK